MPILLLCPAESHRGRKPGLCSLETHPGETGSSQGSQHQASHQVGGGDYECFQGFGKMHLWAGVARFSVEMGKIGLMVGCRTWVKR